MYISEIRTKAPADERMPLERKFYDTLEKLKIPYEHGGTVDDLIVYKKSDEHYFIVVNAANKDKDYQWMLRHQFGEVTFKDVSSEYAQLALQGPKAMEILKKLTAEENVPEKYYHAVFAAVRLPGN